MGDCSANPASKRLPVQLRVLGRTCVIVGGGPVALRKAERLREAGAALRCIAPSCARPEAWANLGGAPTARRYAGPEDLAGALLVVAATDDPGENARIASDARARGVLVLRADAPEDSDLALPATHRQGPLTVSFATDGLSPAYAARLRREAAGIYGEPHARRLEAIRRATDDPAFRALPRPERLRRAKALADQDPDFPRGSVALVGAGPGDPGLLTLKAAERLRAADLVLHDALANPEFLPRFAPQAEWIDVGKHKGSCRLTQDVINARLVAEARLGRRVVRLKGGDPCLFGRAGEEARALAGAGVPFEIVPGVSSFTAVPAAAGIPVTDRDLARSAGAYSLHKRDGRPPRPEEWDRMAAGPETLVLFMGRSLVAEACRELLDRGRPAAQPAALIVNGTLPSQRVVTATLGSLPEAVRDLPPGPGLIVVGEVVRLGTQARPLVDRSGEVPWPA
jgi:uroporphyrin-III C-methyltransferase/precorrin-2 dehydrogenase/sirohydrochlorin ferrochelatase